MARQKMDVQDTEIALLARECEDYISLTGIAKYRNPGFKPLEFERFKTEVGSNYFALSPQRWVEATNSVGNVRNILPPNPQPA